MQMYMYMYMYVYVYVYVYVFFSPHTFSARGPMSPPYCAFGSADCFYTGQSPDVLNPKSTIRMGVGGCCRGVVAGFPRGVG